MWIVQDCGWAKIVISDGVVFLQIDSVVLIVYCVPSLKHWHRSTIFSVCNL